MLLVLRSSHDLQVTTAHAALTFVDKHQKQLLGQPATSACSLFEGRINYVYRVCTCDVGLQQTCVLLKFCPPYVRSLGVGVFPLSQVPSPVAGQKLGGMARVEGCEARAESPYRRPKVKVLPKPQTFNLWPSTLRRAARLSKLPPSNCLRLAARSIPRSCCSMTARRTCWCRRTCPRT